MSLRIVSPNSGELTELLALLLSLALLATHMDPGSHAAGPECGYETFSRRI